MIKTLSKKFDKLLDKYKLDKAVFITYIFFLLSLFFAIDRLYEIFYIMIVGVATTYWHPFLYAFAIACPAISFAYSCSSKFAKTPKHKIKFAVMAAISIYITVLSMMFEWINKIIWIVLVKLENFPFIIENMPEVILPAVKWGTFVAPLFTIPLVVNWYINKIKDDSKYTDSIEDYAGRVGPKDFVATGPYTCDTQLCIDVKTSKPVVTPEKRRYESTLIQGATGTGKTATIVEPMCAYDIEKKFFFKEMSKELGYHALRTGLAKLNKPLSNEFLNYNFSLSYLTPNENRYDEYLKLVNKLVLYEDKENKQIYYKDIGLTLVAPDAECIGRVREVASCYNMKVNYIDPLDPTSLGMNPFILEDPAQVAVIISTVLKGMYESENGGESNIFFAQVTQQAMENLTILLKVMYPRMNNGAMPTLEDMLKMLYDFNLVEQTCEELKKDPVLFEEYKVLVGYFERNFYKPPVNINGFEIPGIVGSGRKDTEKFIYGAITQLDNLLRHPGVKNIICSRDNNINFDEALENGEIITLCSQKGALANVLSKAFGMFFILAFQYAVLRRPGTENTRTPHFLYIDEFPDYLNKETETCFTQFRKYRCGMIVAIQNLSQLERTANMKYYKEVVLTNTKTQIVFGDLNYDDSMYWSKNFGIVEKWVWGGESLNPGDDLSQPKGLSGVKKDDKQKFKPHKLVELGFKACAYKTKDATGKSKIGKGKTDFINPKHKKPHNPKIFNFDPFLFGDYKTETTDFFSGDDTGYSNNTTESIDANIVDENTNINENAYTYDESQFNTDAQNNNNINNTPSYNDDSFNIVFDDDNSSKKKEKKKSVVIDDLYDNSDNVIILEDDDNK